MFLHYFTELLVLQHK